MARAGRLRSSALFVLSTSSFRENMEKEPLDQHAAVDASGLPTHLALVARRLCISAPEDLASRFLATSYLAEAFLKSVAIVLHSGLAVHAREIAYRHAYVRSRPRMVQLKQWKTGPCVFRELCARGVPRNAAASAAAHAQRWWRIAHHPALNLAMPPREFDRLGLPRLAP